MKIIASLSMFKKLTPILLILGALLLSSGCAATPKIYVSDLPKTKFVTVEVATYKESKSENDEWKFSEPIDEEYGKIFEKAFKEKLQERGFTVLHGIPANKDANVNFLIIKVSMSNSSPLIPLLTNGYVAHTTLIYDEKGILLFRLDAATVTDSIITTYKYVAGKKLPPALSEMIADKFLK